MGKVILVLSDGLRDDVSRECMGYLEDLVASGLARRWTEVAELPTLSRPFCETIHTGLPPAAHGIVSNQQERMSEQPNLFGLTRDAAGTTAASAHWWFSRLSVSAGYDQILGREVDDEASVIQHARFDTEDPTPDIETFQAGAMLALRHRPDYLLIHPMGVDAVGEREGGRAAACLDQARLQDIIQANLMRGWLELGCTVIVTADRGVTDQGRHGGTSDAKRRVPLYLVDVLDRNGSNARANVPQCVVAPRVGRPVGIQPAETVRLPPLEVQASRV